MSGHSKWATTKRHKAAVDAKRGKMFSILSKEITIAVRDSGKDPEFNPRLRTVIQKAKAANMPADNVKKAIQKGTGEIPGIIIEEMIYEGYGPSGVGVIVEVTTDNKNRTVSEVRSTFTKCGGNLAGSGALAFNFQRKGQFIIDRNKITEDKLMEIVLESGAEDIKIEEEYFEVLCAVADYDTIAQALEKAGIEADSSELAYIPNNTIVIEDEDTARKVLRMVERLEDLEDVKNVFANYDISDELMKKVEQE
ncbi:MAG: YebC/PmpR family DNA-binding transcriptional regulator [Puniceicoccales bacterium]|jgi:YebC/PmpR family DNA-binding regulatory protein|nr:YebC/PmpR family DNA-binding transcriptional regulator [Puniceicoccales bacterium]